MSAHIDDKTKISLYAVLASIPFLIGGMIWLTSIEAKASAAQDELRNLRPLVEEIKERVIRIDESLKQLKKRER